ncbi:putative lipoprotein [Caballeronia fortuita]|uniref:Lipoprotein n=1 Tax=Caballeronia fortuita TaxID=1777138 RepID=A0A158E418_9BURK|nr:lipoprotein [Caballeronia fortuita]SAL01602.1 putative lipoprotein [Caballeronia fortuita]
MRVVFRMSAIVAALSIGAAATLSLGGCGQRGPLYLPKVPPLPQRPDNLQNTPPSNVAPGNETASRQPLSLSPETNLNSAPKPASSAD